MSSHHIVREKQEPALLVLGLDKFDPEWLGQLLEWSPTVITTAVMAEALVVQDIKIDVVVGDAEDTLSQSDIKYIGAGAEDDATAALQYLAAHGYPSVNIVTSRLQLNVYRPFVTQMDIVVYCGTQKVMAVKPGYSKWAPAGQTVEILEQPVAFLSTGLDTNGINKYISAADGVYTLQFATPYLFIAEQL